MNHKHDTCFLIKHACLLIDKWNGIISVQGTVLLLDAFRIEHRHVHQWAVKQTCSLTPPDARRSLTLCTSQSSLAGPGIH